MVYGKRGGRPRLSQFWRLGYSDDVKNHRRIRPTLPILSTPALAMLLLPACIMPGQKPAFGNNAVSLDPCGKDGLIDNGEDGNNQILVREGRAGY
jgi:hypothetical protein